jgi:ABC-type Fe3+ transport system permease subunit
MSDTSPLSEQLLRQDALAPGTASALVLEQVRRQQAIDEARERFWFRMASGFWIVAGVCVTILAVLAGFESQTSVTVVSGAKGPEEANVARVETTHTDAQFHPIRTPFMAALMLAPIAILGGLFSSACLVLTRRRASRNSLQMTLAALSSEIRELARERRP